MVILTDDDMAELPSTSSREIAVEKFVPSEQIDPMLFEKSYYLEPEKSGAKPYALLRQALLDADRMAVVTVALRQRTTVGVLRVKDRSEEHTSELQSLMRSSYAVFCLKKKTKQRTQVYPSNMN